MIEKPYYVPVSDYRKAGIENCKFIYQNAFEYVKDTTERSNRITVRAFSIITILIPITSAIIAFLYNQVQTGSINKPILFSLTVIVVLCLLVIMLMLGSVIFPRLFMPVGREPKLVADDEMLGVSLEKEYALIALYINEIENCQAKIEYNLLQNLNRTRLLKKAMLSLLALMFSYVITLVTLFFFTLL